MDFSAVCLFHWNFSPNLGKIEGNDLITNIVWPKVSEVFWMEYQEQLHQLITQNPDFMAILRIIRQAHLPQAQLCAGAIRNLVWDKLNDRPSSLIINNLDVYYNDSGESYEQFLITKAKLQQKAPRYLWNLHNIALANRRPNAHAFASVEEAISNFPEIASAIGVQTDFGGNVIITAPYGLNDLFEQKLRPTPLFAQNDPGLEKFTRRVDQKNWLKRYPNVELITLPH